MKLCFVLFFCVRRKKNKKKKWRKGTYCFFCIFHSQKLFVKSVCVCGPLKKNSCQFYFKKKKKMIRKPPFFSNQLKSFTNLFFACSLSSSSSSLLVSSQRCQVWCLEPHSATWMCPSSSCLSRNISNSRKCGKCGNKKPNILIPAGHWLCTQCSTVNPKHVKFCKDCASKFVWPKLWQCPCCAKMNPVAAEPKGGIWKLLESSTTEQNSSAIIGGTPAECNFCSWTARPKSSANEIQEIKKQSLKSSTASPSLADDDSDKTDRNKGGSLTSGLELLREEAVISGQKIEKLSDIRPEEEELQDLEEEQPSQDELPDLGAPGFPWLCRNKDCGAENPGTVSTCRECGWKIWPSDWMCSSCGVSNFKMRSECFNCNSPIQPYWHCVGCKKNSSIYEKRCRSCAVKRPVPTGNGVNLGGGGGGGAASSAAKRAGSGQGDWVCAVCHKFNYARRTNCFSCETPRGGSAEGMPTVSEITPVGDSNWRCHICSALNFRSRTGCWQCQTTRSNDFASEGIQIQQDFDTAPLIDREGFQTMNAEGAGGGGSSIKDQSEAAKVERRRKAIEHAAGWSGSGQFDHRRNQGGMFHPPGTANLADAADDGQDWVCAKCMRRNFGGTTECGRCMAPKTVAPGSRALASLAANKTKKIHKL